MKKWWILGFVGFAFISGALLFQIEGGSDRAELKIGDEVFSMRVARSNSELNQGLSGTESMPENEALLFMFPYSNRWGIWMKDMNYPIDIVWLDENKKVLHIEHDVKPESYPATTYEPESPAKYVVELKAGAAKAHRITIGSQADFDSTKGTFL
jgi:uncharacterized membrane protein (UPF0127 family)